MKAYLVLCLLFLFAPLMVSGFIVDNIIIDPGHGGKDPGAIDKESNLMEKSINLKISKYLTELIKEHLKDVHITRTRDSDVFISLGQRSKIANPFLGKKAFFISIHTNSHNSKKKVKGVEVFYHYTSNSTIGVFRLKEIQNSLIKAGYTENVLALSQIINAKSKEDSKKLAHYLASGLNLASGEYIRQVSPSNLYVVSYSVIPAVLVEVGFIRSSKLRNDEYLKKLAKGIFLGVLNYIKEVKKM